MRMLYLIAAGIVSVFVLFNVPRLPWIGGGEGISFILFRGFNDGMIGFSYLVSWLLTTGGVYQLILGVLYWDMDTTEGERWEYILHSGWTAKLLWATGFICLGLGIWYLVWTFGADRHATSAGIAASVVALINCWLYWLAFPLYEQVGIDRDELYS